MKLGVLLCAAALLCSAAEPTLIGGRVAGNGEFPEIIYVKQGTSRCSATLISSNVILTAAHCVPDHGSIGPVAAPVMFVVAGERYSALCRQAPAYRERRGDHDLALCKVDRNLPMQPAYIADKGPSVGQSVVLTGYGCVRSPGTGGNDRILRVGLVKVTELPRGTSRDFVTVGSVALCFGDSGSSAQAIPVKGSQHHQVLGVNSKGNIRDTSYLTSVTIPESRRFLRDFAAEQDVQICGVTPDC